MSYLQRYESKIIKTRADRNCSRCHKVIPKGSKVKYKYNPPMADDRHWYCNKCHAIDSDEPQKGDEPDGL